MMTVHDLKELIVKYDLKDADEVLFDCAAESKEIKVNGSTLTLDLSYVKTCCCQYDGSPQKTLQIILNVSHNNKESD
jgi:hypothetical protein